MLLAEHRGLAVHVHITPAQPGRLAPAQAAQRDQAIGGVQPVLSDRGQERDGLRACPHRNDRRSPDRRHCATRDGVHTTARGCRGRGSSALAAGFSLISPRPIAAFKATRKVARIRVKSGG